MHYYSIHLDIIISSQICLFYCFMPTWVIFRVIFVAMVAILKMPPLCWKSRLACKNLFLYFSHHILPPFQKEKNSVRCHFLGLVRSLRKLVLSFMEIKIVSALKLRCLWFWIVFIMFLVSFWVGSRFTMVCTLQLTLL